MDPKDLELITLLTQYGRWDETALSSRLSISPDNVGRRIRLLLKEGQVSGFSAFFDRRMFGYDTTFLKLHFDMRSMDRVIAEVSGMPQVASVYPNMDDFMLVEVVHWDGASLKAAIKALERAAHPYTVSAHIAPQLPEEVPEPPKGRSLELLKLLVKDGRADLESLSSSIGLNTEKTGERLKDLLERTGVKIKPIVNEHLIEPFPTFSVLIELIEGCTLDTCYSDLTRISKGSWDQLPLGSPPGIWLHCFGSDLHAMDTMLERYRRMDEIRDVMVILPDSLVTKRSVDINILRGSKKNRLF
ncbi:MAG: Lrp/AsnC family transcriptional regulator [Thermoplasmatota archaeon]